MTENIPTRPLGVQKNDYLQGWRALNEDILSRLKDARAYYFNGFDVIGSKTAISIQSTAYPDGRIELK